MGAVDSILFGRLLFGTDFLLGSGDGRLRMRALASSIILFIANIIGLGLGPQFTGIASDILFVTTDLGQDSLRWA